MGCWSNFYPHSSFFLIYLRSPAYSLYVKNNTENDIGIGIKGIGPTGVFGTTIPGVSVGKGVVGAASGGQRAVMAEQSESGFGFYQSGANAKNYFEGKVGIGTQTPTFPLEVNGWAAVSGSNAGFYLYPRDGSGTAWGLYNPTGDKLQIWNGSDRVTIDNSGKVGIGITSPQEKLDLGGGNVKMGYIKRQAYSGPGASSVQVVCVDNEYVVSGGCSSNPISDAPRTFGPSSNTAWLCSWGSGQPGVTREAIAICANIR